MLTKAASLYSKKYGNFWLLPVRFWLFQKQPPRGVPWKRFSENMQYIYRRTPILKCDFIQLYWNCTLAWVFSCKVAAYFQNTFSQEHLWVAASVVSGFKMYMKLFMKSTTKNVLKHSKCMRGRGQQVNAFKELLMYPSVSLLINKTSFSRNQQYLFDRNFFLTFFDATRYCSRKFFLLIRKNFVILQLNKSNWKKYCAKPSRSIYFLELLKNKKLLYYNHWRQAAKLQGS